MPSKFCPHDNQTTKGSNNAIHLIICETCGEILYKHVVMRANEEMVSMFREQDHLERQKTYLDSQIKEAKSLSKDWGNGKEHAKVLEAERKRTLEKISEVQEEKKLVLKLNRCKIRNSAVLKKPVTVNRPAGLRGKR